MSFLSPGQRESAPFDDDETVLSSRSHEREHERALVQLYVVIGRSSVTAAAIASATAAAGQRDGGDGETALSDHQGHLYRHPWHQRSLHADGHYE